MSGRESIVEYKGFKKEFIKERGRIYNLHHFIETIGGMRIDFYLDQDGNVIKETSPTGFVFYSEPEFRAKDIISKGKELLSTVSVPAIGDIENLSGLSTISYRLTLPEDQNFDLNQDRQIFNNNILTINKEEIPPENARICIDNNNLLNATPYIQSDNKLILEQAESIIANTTNDLQKVRELINWVYVNIEKKPVLSIPDAVTTLRTRVGDCNEHAALFAALSRSVSIPARVAAGVTYHDGTFYYHAWNEVCINGKWISLDTTNNQFPADVSHIKFVEGETIEQVKIGALLGRLTIEILEVNS
ncbi:MAG: transglutaminase-like domain-containing protein [Candidatus Neomarinimicrobiota bacterium]|nr:transglutaminase-like domain-containing protein [Candidatus Neomarinimicrobiota bacterium]